MIIEIRNGIKRLFRGAANFVAPLAMLVSVAACSQRLFETHFFVEKEAALTGASALEFSDAFSKYLGHAGFSCGGYRSSGWMSCYESSGKNDYSTINFRFSADEVEFQVWTLRVVGAFSGFPKVHQNTERLVVDYLAAFDIDREIRKIDGRVYLEK